MIDSDRSPRARRPRSARLQLLWLLPVLLAGAALRLYRLAPQVLDGDELHAVRSAVSQPLPAILTTYPESDNCIPLTALFKLLLDAGVRLSEMGFRMPSVVAGLLLLVLLPLAVAGLMDGMDRMDLMEWTDRMDPMGAAGGSLPPGRGEVGGRGEARRGAPQLPPTPQRPLLLTLTYASRSIPLALAYGSLVALSPLLVFYSRIARSYLPMTLCAVAAAAAFALWWRSLAPRHSFAYVVLGGLAVWLHLAAAPFVGAPFLFALGDLLWGPIPPAERRGRLRRLALLALGLALAVLSFLLPARESLRQLVAGKRQAQAVGWETISAVLSLQAGTASVLLGVLFWLLVLAGLAALWVFGRSAGRRAALFLLTLAGVQILGIRLLSPLGLGNPLILDRYLLPVLPLVLFALAFALVFPWPLPARFQPAGAVLQGVLAIGFVLALAAGGPLADRVLWRSSFQHGDDFLAFYQPLAPVAPDLVPEPYRRMAGGAAGAVIEYPWSSFAGLRAPARYQPAHGREVRVSGPQRLLAAPVLNLRNFVAPNAEAFCASGARFLAVHLQIGREEDRLAAAAPRPWEKEMRAELRRTLRIQGETTAGDLTARWGDPTDSAPGLRVWDLAQVCGR